LPLPEKVGSVPPGEYKTTVFEPPLSFRVAEEGWRLQHPERPDVIGLQMDGTYVSIIDVEEVYPESPAGDEPAVSAPKDMVAFITNHDDLAIEKQERIVVDGESGVKFNHIDPLVPHQGVAACEGTPCRPLFALHTKDQGGDGQAMDMGGKPTMKPMTFALRGDESAVCIVLPNVQGKTVTIFIQGTHEALDQNMRKVMNLLGTVHWIE
jgi:hypothetical protein